MELEGQVAEIELMNEAAEKQHESLMKDIEDSEELRSITRATDKTNKALKALKALERLQDNATKLANLGVDVDAVVLEQTQLIQGCFA